MATSFTLMSDPAETQEIALRLWDGSENGCTVRFAFPGALFIHLRHVELSGSDGSTLTVQELHDQAVTVDFLTEDNSPRDHLSFGTDGSREQARLAWERH